MVAEESVLTGRLVMFRVGSGRFAVLLEDVLGIQGPAEIGTGAEHEVMFQGHPVAAVDVREIWSGGLDHPAAQVAAAVIVARGGGGLIALLVDRVEGIVEGVEMRPLPALVAPFVKDVFRGVTLHDDGDRLLVDPAALSGGSVGGQRGPGEA